MPKFKKPKGVSPSGKAQDISFLRWFLAHVFSLLRRQGKVVTFWIAIAYCVRVMATAAEAYAGRSSTANFAISIMANLNFVWTTSIVVSGFSVSLYLRERTLHRNTRERLTRRITELELKIDPTRTSSKLTSQGLTRKEDQ